MRIGNERSLSERPGWYLGTFSVADHAREPKVFVNHGEADSRVARERPYWDSYIVPRYRYRPEGRPGRSMRRARSAEVISLGLKRKRFRWVAKALGLGAGTCVEIGSVRSKPVMPRLNTENFSLSPHKPTSAPWTYQKHGPSVCRAAFSVPYGPEDGLPSQ